PAVADTRKATERPFIAEITVKARWTFCFAVARRIGDLIDGDFADLPLGGCCRLLRLPPVAAPTPSCR
ncbi:hypothetical protein Ancab_032457, partial [Ancistrocladus abbreviatus]